MFVAQFHCQLHSEGVERLKPLALGWAPTSSDWRVGQSAIGWAWEACRLHCNHWSYRSSCLLLQSSSTAVNYTVMTGIRLKMSCGSVQMNKTIQIDANYRLKRLKIMKVRTSQWLSAQSKLYSSVSDHKLDLHSLVGDAPSTWNHPFINNLWCLFIGLLKLHVEEKSFNK